jgi:hypothetical protein
LDNFLVDGWSALYRIALAILRTLEPQILLLNDIGKVSKRFHAFKTEDNQTQILIIKRHFEKQKSSGLVSYART